MEADHEIRIVALNVLQVLVNVAKGPEHEIIHRVRLAKAVGR